MLNLLYWSIWLDYHKALSLINVDCKKKAMLCAKEITIDWYDIIDDCYTFKILEKQIKDLIDMEYDWIVINGLDMMILNSGIKKEYETITELSSMLTRLALASKMKYKAKITVITAEKILMEYRQLEQWYQIQIAKFVPSLHPDLQNVLEYYCNNVWRVWIDPITTKQKIQDTPHAQSQTFSSWIIINNDVLTEETKIEDIGPPESEDNTEEKTKPEFTRKVEWLHLYKQPENFFEVSADAERLFNEVKKWVIPYLELEQRVANSKKLSKDKIPKALAFLSSLNKLING